MLDLDAETTYAELARRVREHIAGRGSVAPVLVGVHTGGVWLAERLRADLGIAPEVGILDVSFYRDDYSQGGLTRGVRPSQIPFAIDGAHVLLIDDVLNTGRTVRAAMNELFDYGRPRSISLVVLADRGGRQLPISAQYCGAQVEVPEGMRLRLKRAANGRLSLELEHAG